MQAKASLTNIHRKQKISKLKTWPKGCHGHYPPKPKDILNWKYASLLGMKLLCNQDESTKSKEDRFKKVVKHYQKKMDANVGVRMPYINQLLTATKNNIYFKKG
jgi:hypothetical protein